jgi:trk system potassium uptake protein TrkA
MKNLAIIGVGNFGYFLCKSLSERGHEVMAVDADEGAVERAAAIAANAVVADATDRAALEALGLKDFDSVIVSLGEHIDASVLTTLYLKEMGVRNVIVKAISEDHMKVLDRIGADEVVFPERDMAERLAYRLADADVLEFIPIGSDYGLVEWAPAQEMVGHSLKDLHLRREHNVTVILVRQVIPDQVVVAPDGDFVVKDSDVLVLLGRNEDLDLLRRRYGSD